MMEEKLLTEAARLMSELFSRPSMQEIFSSRAASLGAAFGSLRLRMEARGSGADASADAEARMMGALAEAEPQMMAVSAAERQEEPAAAGAAPEDGRQELMLLLEKAAELVLGSAASLPEGRDALCREDPVARTERAAAAAELSAALHLLVLGVCGRSAAMGAGRKARKENREAFALRKTYEERLRSLIRGEEETLIFEAAERSKKSSCVFNT